MIRELEGYVLEMQVCATSADHRSIICAGLENIQSEYNRGINVLCEELAPNEWVVRT